MISDQSGSIPYSSNVTPRPWALIRLVPDLRRVASAGSVGLGASSQALLLQRPL